MIMLCGLEIKRLSEFLKNTQKQDEMRTEGWLTSKKVYTFHAVLVELCYFYKSRDEMVSSDFHCWGGRLSRGSRKILLASSSFFSFPVNKSNLHDKR